VSGEPTFEERIAERIAEMSPAEQRVVHFFANNREEVLILSAAALAARVETSDATVIRAAKALGFAGLEELRRTLADELRHSLSPAARLTRTLSEIGGKLPAALAATIDLHVRSLDTVRRRVTVDEFEKAVNGIAGAGRIVVFGLGPSAAIANYLVTQLTRFGLDALSLTNTGLLFADDLRRLRDGDLVIMLAYGRVYGELAALLDEISRQRLSSFLITDTLAGRLQRRVDLILRVPRGQADMFSMHTATLGFIEALLVGVATRRPAETLASLNALNEARARLAGNTMKLPVARKP
jgi:DNA-binding MurR/RpiR family transcriptional regulator